NLMSYVSFVFQQYFGYSKEKSERLMMDVHVKGRAAVAHGDREVMERHVEALHGYGLWATMQRDD
ncbi:MAG: ATP-dependent Clp protease adapter ClpS, partial [Angustibacter sp.]